jgi:hypothetical protein
MKTFYIKAAMTTYLETTIEAENENEAWSIAQEMYAGDFTAIYDDSGWDILIVNEITSGDTK